MSRLLAVMILLSIFCMSACAVEYTAPPVPDSGEILMPEQAAFGEGLWEMVERALSYIYPDMHEALKICTSVAATVLLMSLIQSCSGSGEKIFELTGVVVISFLILGNANSMIILSSKTVTEISEYGKLLLPVLTAALAAQGGITTSASLYAGTVVFNAVISAFISQVLRPLVYCFLALAVATAAAGEGILKNMRDLIKTFSSWCLKTLLIVFTSYMSITGVISGTTDAATLKAAKVTISSFVPVVGSILSDASEAVLVSAGLAKNAAGIYGIFAVLAVFLVPFLKIGIHYILLKMTYALCSILGSKRIGELIGDFSAAMGMLLAMTGSICLIQLISTVCFLKGVG